MTVTHYKLNIKTEENITLEYESAQLFSRTLAWLVDFIIYMNIILLLSLTFTVIDEVIGIYGYITGFIEYFVIIIIFFVYWFYFTLFEVIFKGKTPGKFIFKIRVINASRGTKINFWQSMLRNLVRLVDMLPFGYLVGVISILVDKKSRRLGDILSGTVVIKDPFVPEYVDLKRDNIYLDNNRSKFKDMRYKAWRRLIPEEIYLIILTFFNEQGILSLEERCYIAYKLAEKVEQLTGIKRESFISPEKYLSYFVYGPPIHSSPDDSVKHIK